MGGTPGLVVMVGDSCSDVRGFESQNHLLDGHFFTYICYKNCNDDCLKRPKINDKRGRGWPNFLKNSVTSDPFFQSSPKWSHTLFKKCPISHQIFGLFLWEKLFPRSFKNHPISSHCRQILCEWILTESLNHILSDKIFPASLV